MDTLSYAATSNKPLHELSSCKDSDEATLLAACTDISCSVVPDPVWSPDTTVLIKNLGPALAVDGGPSKYSLLLEWFSETGTGYPHDSCGQFLRTAAVCGNKPHLHKPLLIPDSCGRRGCPECWDGWATRRGEDVRDRLDSYLLSLHGPEQQALPGMAREQVLSRHFWFSPDERDVYLLTLKALNKAKSADEFQRIFYKMFRKWATQIVQEAGITAGVLIIHDIRLKKEKEAVKADRLNTVSRYRDVLDRPDWREHVSFSPHVHVIGHGYIEDYHTFHERTGWRYGFLRIVEEPERLIRYLLSHAPDIPGEKLGRAGCNSYTYIGALAPRRQEKVKEYRHREYILCDECIEAGIPDTQSERVIALLEEGSLVCEHDHSIHARHAAGGRGPPVKWVIEEISKHRYSKVHRYTVYRPRVPGPPRRGRRVGPWWGGPGILDGASGRPGPRVEWVSAERFNHLLRSSWYRKHEAVL